jgi:hypothetical protein
MNNFANLGSASDQKRSATAIDDDDDGDSRGDADGAFQAGLFYVAGDLRELAKTAPPVKADEVLALCRLVEAMAKP